MQLEIEHEDIVGRGEASPVSYHGESTPSAAEFLSEAAPPLIGDDPFALEDIGSRLEDVEGSGGRQGGGRRRAARLDRQAARPARLAAARALAERARHLVHDRHRHVDGTRDRVRRARGFRALKVKVGGGRGPRPARGGAGRVDAPDAGRRERGLDARAGPRADAGAGRARRRVRRAAVPGGRRRVVPRPARAHAAAARRGRRGLPRPERRRRGRRSTPRASTSSWPRRGASERLCG